MPRLDKLEDVLFPVEEHPVFVRFTDPKGERRLPVPEKKAIVNRNNERILGIVSRDYRLVSNKEALDLAYQCCGKVFPETKAGEWDVKTTDAPATGSYCHLDLVHNSTALDFKAVPAAERPEVFGPFIRVTNSYNGLRALAFDIGFYRKVCKNGMIIPDTIIRFQFTHSPREIGESIKFNVAHEPASVPSLKRCATVKWGAQHLNRSSAAFCCSGNPRPRSRTATKLPTGKRSTPKLVK